MVPRASKFDFKSEGFIASNRPSRLINYLRSRCASEAANWSASCPEKVECAVRAAHLFIDMVERRETAQSPIRRMRPVVRRQQKNRRPVGPHSRNTALSKLDGRRREAKRLAAIVDDLTRFAAGASNTVTIGQVYLIKRLAIDVLRLELLDGEMTMSTISQADAVVAHALRNSVRLGLRDLRRPEFRAAPPPPKPTAGIPDDYDELVRQLGGLQ
jgi:hypothetical protein